MAHIYGKLNFEGLYSHPQLNDINLEIILGKNTLLGTWRSKRIDHNKSCLGPDMFWKKKYPQTKRKASPSILGAQFRARLKSLNTIVLQWFDRFQREGVPQFNPHDSERCQLFFLSGLGRTWCVDGCHGLILLASERNLAPLFWSSSSFKWRKDLDLSWRKRERSLNFPPLSNGQDR